MSPRRARTAPGSTDGADDHGVVVHLDHLLATHGLTLTELADRMGLSVVNLSILKNGRAKAVRFSTLTALCRALNCQPGDVLSVDPVDRADRG